MSKMLMVPLIVFGLVNVTSDAFAQTKQSGGKYCKPTERGYVHPNKADCLALCKKRHGASTIGSCNLFCEVNCSR